METVGLQGRRVGVGVTELSAHTVCTPSIIESFSRVESASEYPKLDGSIIVFMENVSGHWLSFTEGLFLECEACKCATLEEVSFQEVILWGKDDSCLQRGSFLESETLG